MQHEDAGEESGKHASPDFGEPAQGEEAPSPAAPGSGEPGDEDAADCAPRRAPPRWALIGAATLLGAFAAFCSTRLLSSEKPRDGQAAASAAGDRREAGAVGARRRESSPAERAPGPWPRPLPREPGQWLRQTAAECGLRLTGLRTEAHATTFPSPSGASVVLWEVSMRLGAEGVIDDVHALMDRLGAAPCGVNVPELNLTWLPGKRLKLQLHAVLLGTWPNRPAPAARRDGRS